MGTHGVHRHPESPCLWPGLDYQHAQFIPIFTQVISRALLFDEIAELCACGCDFPKISRPTPATNTELQQQNTTTGGIATTRIRWPRHDLLRDVLRFLLEDNAKFYSARSWRHAFLRNHLLVYTLANHTQITHHTTTPLDCALPTVLLSKHSLVFASHPRNPRITNLQFNASQMSDKALGSMSAF